MQAVLTRSSIEQTHSSETLALVAVRHEHAERWRLMQRATLRDAAPADTNAGAGAQLRQLQRRVTEMLPPKVASRAPSGVASVVELELVAMRGLEAGALAQALRQSLAECECSATPGLDGAAPAEMALSAWHHFLLWCEPPCLQSLRLVEREDAQATMPIGHQGTRN